MCKIYNKHFLFCDLVISIAVAIIILLVLRHYFSYDNIESTLKNNRIYIYPVIASVSGTLLGFVITGVAVIISFSESDSEKFKLLKNSSHYKEVYDIYFSSIKYLSITAIISVIGIFLSGNWQTPFNVHGILIANSYDMVVFYIVFLTVTVTVVRLYRCVWVLEKIVSILFSST